MLTKDVSKAFLSLAEAFDTPRSLAMAILCQYGEELQLASMVVDPLNYLQRDFPKFRDDLLITEYLSKYKGLQTGVDTKAVGFAKFRQSEARCKSTNSRLRDTSSLTGRRGHIISMAMRKIESVLGTGPKWKDLADRYRWGKGATSTLKSTEATLDNKLRERSISVTPSALPYLRYTMALDYPWLRARGVQCDGPLSLLDDDFQLVTGCRGLVVDKNAKGGRFIAAEPTGNLFLQLGIGGYIRTALLRVGIDLDSQQRNQDLAEAALDLGLATVDLSSASDTISTALVWQLLPLRWAILLDDVRSHTVDIEGDVIHLEKFSSMGNGFTFELETLIFWALSSSVLEYLDLSVEHLSVYGDDIILPAAAVPLLQEVFDYAGFEVNMSKTHFASLFRESCGKQFFGGKDVTPIYQKEVPRTLVERYRFHNRLLLHAIRRGAFIGDLAIADGALERAVEIARRTVEGCRGPQNIKVHYIPISPDSNDLSAGLISNEGKERGRRTPRGWLFKGMKFYPQGQPAHGGAMLAAWLRFAPASRDFVALQAAPRSGKMEMLKDADYEVTPRGQGTWRQTHVCLRTMGDIVWA